MAIMLTGHENTHAPATPSHVLVAVKMYGERSHIPFVRY